ETSGFLPRSANASTLVRWSSPPTRGHEAWMAVSSRVRVPFASTPAGTVLSFGVATGSNGRDADEAQSRTISIEPMRFVIGIVASSLAVRTYVLAGVTGRLLVAGNRDIGAAPASIYVVPDPRTSAPFIRHDDAEAALHEWLLFSRMPTNDQGTR